MEGMQLRRRKRRPHSRRKMPVSDSEDEQQELAALDQPPKPKASRKIINSIESDEDRKLERISRRSPSSRASKLKQDRSVRQTKLLEKLQEGISSSESDLTSDTEERNERSMTGGRYTQGVYVYSDLDGEQILFPESSGEESEWIVSDLEDTTTGTPIGMGGADNEQEDRRWNPIAGAERLVGTEDWRTHLSGLKIFPAQVVSTPSCKSSDLLLNSNNPNSPDQHGLYPLIYSAALADEEALKQLLPCTTMELVQEVLKTHYTTLLNVIIEAPLREIEKGSTDEKEDDLASLRCLEILFFLNEKCFQSILLADCIHSPTALSVAVWNHKPQCVRYLLEKGAPTEMCETGLVHLPTLLHLAVMVNGNDGEFSGQEARGRVGSVALLMELLPKLCDQLDIPDQSGFTPLMRACVVGDVGCLRVLLHHGASINCRDPQKTSPLHLAAVSGWTDCITELIISCHPVDCVDNKGWSPLLYAHFQNNQDCVLELMKVKPQQISLLSNLLEMNREEEGWVLTVKVVRSLLVSLAHHEAYHAMFNQFVRHNPLILEEKEYGFLKHCMGLLDYRNKLHWIRRKLNILTEHVKCVNPGGTKSLSLVSLPRSPPQGLLSVVHNRLNPIAPYSCWIQSLSVTFAREAGICTGPRKEFWCLYCQEAASGKDNIFTASDNGQLMYTLLQPGVIMTQYSSSHPVLTTRLATVHHVGMMLAQAVFHDDNIPIRLAQPLLKQLLGIPLSHPDDLEQVNRSLYYNLTQCDDMSALDLVFAEGIQSPWNAEFISIPLLDGGCGNAVNNKNKDMYVRLVSEFKLEKCISEETRSFCEGFWKVIPQKCLQVFTTNELSLFLSGVPKIDVDDWEKHTEYCNGISEETIVWFWRLVRSLKEEEKALLLKFATGSPCIPAGGFKNLQGLGGTTPFHIQEVQGVNKIPHASTCFNTLKLSSYTSEQELRDKTLIAIRFGCEGFEFS